MSDATESVASPSWRPEMGLGARVKAYDFAGARRDEWSSQWLTRLHDWDDSIAPDLQTLWERSDDLHRNSAIIQGATDTMVRGIVGRGLQAIPRCVTGSDVLDDRIRQRLASLWRDYSVTAGADGVTGFADKCRQAVHLMVRHGDCLAVWTATGDGAIPTRVDIVTAPRVETPPKAGDSVRLGVVYRGRKVDAYTVRKSARRKAVTDSGDYYTWKRRNMGVWGANLLARPMCVMPGQSRAYPLISSAIRTIKDFETYLQAELRRSITNSKIAGVIQAPDPTVIEKAFQNLNTMPNGSSYQKSYLGRSFGTLFDAQIMSLATGESMQLFSPNNTNSGLASYIETVLRVIANAYGLPHSIAFSLYSDINFSNARTQILQARRTFEIWRDVLVSGFCRPTWERFVTDVWASGLLPEVREVTPDLLRCDWRADVEPWVDPLKEVKANELAVAHMFASHESIAAERGEDAKAIATQEMEYIAWRKTEMQRLGLEPHDIGLLPQETISTQEEPYD